MAAPAGQGALDDVAALCFDYGPLGCVLAPARRGSGMMGRAPKRDLLSEEAAIKRKDELEAAAELFPAVQSFAIDGRTIEARLIPDTDDDGWDLYDGDEHLNLGAIVWCEGGLGKYGGITEADVRAFLKKNLQSK